jgi:hypothetical protein
MCPLIRELTDAGSIRPRGIFASRVQASTIARLTHSCTARQSEEESRPTREIMAVFGIVATYARKAVANGNPAPLQSLNAWSVGPIAFANCVVSKPTMRSGRAAWYSLDERITAGLRLVVTAPGKWTQKISPASATGVLVGLGGRCIFQRICSEIRHVFIAPIVADI